MNVHSGAVHAEDRLRHEGRVEAVVEGDLLDDQLERRDVVGRVDGVPVLEVDLVLAGGDLVVRRLDLEAHRLEGDDDVPPGVLAPVDGREVEVAALRRACRRRGRRRRRGGRGRTRPRARSSARSRAPSPSPSAASALWRGQPANGLPSGSMMSQTSRATFPFGCDHGKIWNVLRSGTRPMSDSWIRTKPSIDEPSNWISPSSAFSNCERGTSTFLMIAEDVRELEPQEADPLLVAALQDVCRVHRHLLHSLSKWAGRAMTGRILTHLPLLSIEMRRNAPISVQKCY